MIRAVVDDHQRAPIPEKLRATLTFLRKMTLDPDALTADDASAVRAAGVTDDALRDAIHVAFMFNIINRVADALNFAIPSDAGFASSAQMLLRFGYRL